MCRETQRTLGTGRRWWLERGRQSSGQEISIWGSSFVYTVFTKDMASFLPHKLGNHVSLNSSSQHKIRKWTQLHHPRRKAAAQQAFGLSLSFRSLHLGAVTKLSQCG